MSSAAEVEARVHNHLLESARAGSLAPTRATIVELETALEAFKNLLSSKISAL